MIPCKPRPAWYEEVQVNVIVDPGTDIRLPKTFEVPSTWLFGKPRIERFGVATEGGQVLSNGIFWSITLGIPEDEFYG